MAMRASGSGCLAPERATTSKICYVLLATKQTCDPVNHPFKKQRIKGTGISSPTAESYGIDVLTMKLFPKRKRQLIPRLPSNGIHLAVGDTTWAYIFLLSS